MTSGGVQDDKLGSAGYKLVSAGYKLVSAGYKLGSRDDRYAKYYNAFLDFEVIVVVAIYIEE